MKCEKCGKELEPKTKFCNSCGLKVQNKSNKNKIVIGVIVLVLLIIIGIVIINLLNNNSKEDYEKFEEKLEDAASNYIIKNYYKLEKKSTSNVIIDDLKEENLINDELLNKCNGYVLIHSKDNEEIDDDYDYDAYIACRGYKTKGYDKKYAKNSQLNSYGKNLYFYQNKENPDLIISKYDKEENGKLLGKYVCNSMICSSEEIEKDGKKYVVTHKDRYIIINDKEKISIYDYKDNKKINTDIGFSSNIKDVKTDKKYYGIIINQKDKGILYSIDDNKILYEIGGSISIPHKEYVKRGYVVIESKDYSEKLLDLNTLKVKENSIIHDYGYYSYSDEFKIPIIFYADTIDFLDTNMNRVFNEMYYGIMYIDNLAYVYKQNTNEYKIFNKDNDKVEVKNTRYPILGLVKNYIVINKDGIVTLTDYNNNIVKEIFTLGNNKYDIFASGYYDAHDNYPSGLYLVFRDNSGNSCFEYHYNENTKVSTKYNLDHCGNYGKPVLYLYPKKEMTVTVNFEKEENLTTTYPKYKNEWKVKANPNGDLYDEDGKYYYGLYWEETLNHRVDFSTGFYVTKENAIDFLEDKLSYIGLNNKERNEFIMYWLPILEKNDKSLVYFELTEERDTFSKLIINPKPDSMLRVAIHVKKVDKKVNIKQQQLKKFNRKGFAIVEWGGVIY